MSRSPLLRNFPLSHVPDVAGDNNLCSVLSESTLMRPDLRNKGPGTTNLSPNEKPSGTINPIGSQRSY